MVVAETALIHNAETGIVPQELYTSFIPHLNHYNFTLSLLPISTTR